MRLRLTILAALLLLQTFTFGPVQADKASDARKAIQAAYDRRNAAMMKKDSDAYLASYAPDFVYIKVNGDKRNMEEERALMERALPIMHMEKASTKIVKFALKGAQAMVVIDMHFVGRLPNRQTGGTVPIVNDETTEDTWQQSNGKWLLKRSRSLKDESIIDGKPVVRPKKGTGKPSS